MKVCTLISSCDKYRPIAEWTASRIAKHWDRHPEIFFSGLSQRLPNNLGLRGDLKDWMGITKHAVEGLLERGFKYGYLILDDLPPLQRCHDRFLNNHLPETAERLSATYIGLLGWGQHRPTEGVLMANNHHCLEKSSPNYRWKFSLHPGLWNLERLYDLLNIRMMQYQPEERTPWRFERHQDDSSGAVPVEYLNSCYRVCGARYDHAPGRRRRAAAQSLGLFLCDWLVFIGKLKGGMTYRTQLTTRLLWPYCYYRGPYPVFWSGVMRQGKPSAEWETFLRWFDVGGMREEWKSVRRQLSEISAG